MKEYDTVRLIVEKERYAKHGVHKGICGWICDPRIINGQRLVCFDDDIFPMYPIIEVKIEDLEVVEEAPVMQIGTRVLLYTDKYEEYGIKKGWRGFVCQKGEQEGQWLVRFDKESEDSEEIYYNIYEKHLAFE